MTGLLVPLLTLAVFLTSLAGYALGPLLPAMARDMHTPVATLGQVPAVAALVMAALGLVVGPLADRVGHRLSLIVALAALAASAASLAVAPGIALLFGAAVIGGVGRAAAAPICQAIAGTRFEGDARRRALGWLLAGTSAAVVAGVPALTSVAQGFGWRGAFVALAAVTAAAAAVIVRLLPSGPGPSGTAPHAPGSGPNERATALAGAYAPILRHRSTLALITGHLCGTAGAHTVLTYLGAYLAASHALGTQQIGWVYMAVGAGAVVGSLATGGRLGQLPLRPLLVTTRAGVGLLAGAAFLLPAPASVAFAAGLLMLAFVLSPVSTVATHTLLTSETPGGRATTMALNGTATGLGTACGAGLGGLLLAAGGFPAVAGAAAVWCALGAAVVWWSRPKPAAAWVPALQPAGAGPAWPA